MEVALCNIHMFLIHFCIADINVFLSCKQDNINLFTLKHFVDSIFSEILIHTFANMNYVTGERRKIL